MRWFRFSIASLLGVVLLVAIAVAALRSASDPWDSGLFGLTLVTLLVSVLLTVHRVERQRAYWLGFALFGWAYLVASLIPPIESRLPTTRGIAFLASRWPALSPQGMAFADFDNDGSLDLFVVNASAPGTVYLNNGNGSFQNKATWALAGQPGSPPIFRGTPITIGSPAHFARILHSLLALVIAFAGGHLSGFLYTTSRHRREIEPNAPPGESLA